MQCGWAGAHLVAAQLNDLDVLDLGPLVVLLLQRLVNRRQVRQVLRSTCTEYHPSIFKIVPVKFPEP